MNHYLGDTYYQNHPEASILFKTPLVKAIENTSAGDMLLFLIALAREEKKKEMK